MKKGWRSTCLSCSEGRRAPMISIRKLTLAAVVAMAVVWPAGVRAQRTTIAGAGGTFPYPLYSEWFTEYGKLKPDVHIAYQSIGSGAGIRQLTDRFVFFGATDAPMLEEELLNAPA